MKDVTVVVMVTCDDKKSSGKDESVGLSTYLAPQEGNNVQSRWNEHNQWDFFFFNSHSVAGLWHGDTQVRAFT